MRSGGRSTCSCGPSSWTGLPSWCRHIHLITRLMSPTLRRGAMHSEGSTGLSSGRRPRVTLRSTESQRRSCRECGRVPPRTTFDAEIAPELIGRVFSAVSAVEVQTWDGPFIHLPDAEAVRRYLIGRGLDARLGL